MKSTNISIEELSKEIHEWSSKTFGQEDNNLPPLYHLKEEVQELIDASERYRDSNTIKHPYKHTTTLTKEVFMEYADCLILLLDSSHRFGITVEMLLYYTNEKLEINKNRTWEKPDKHGVTHHK